MLSPETRSALLSNATEHLLCHLRDEPTPEPPHGGEFNIQAPVFVTLRSRGELRGCIGNLNPTMPLGECVGKTAIESATSDPRFPPVKLGEIESLSLEISVLTERTRAQPDEIVVGQHGVCIESAGRRALLLPQVASEYGLTVEQFLAMVCRKAGLPNSAWTRPDVLLETFEAEVFSVDHVV